MIELIMAIVIISVGIAGILLVMQITIKSSADPMISKQALAMAESILAEVMAKSCQGASCTGSFVETSPTCANRIFYDGVSNYTCFSGTPTSNVIQGSTTLGGSATTLQGYTATVTVTPMTIYNTISTVGIAMFKVIVTVTGNGISVSLDSYRSNI